MTSRPTADRLIAVHEMKSSETLQNSLMMSCVEMNQRERDVLYVAKYRSAR